MQAAENIASWFILRAKDDGDLTLLKLEKLLYYAEGCSLALGNGSLFEDSILAWEHGPVVEAVYEKYKSDPFHLPIEDRDYALASIIGPQESNVLTQVYDIFGAYSASGLRNKTHSEEPWLEATQQGTRLNGIISRETMKRYFIEHYVEL